MPGFALSIGTIYYGLVATPPDSQTTNPSLHMLRWLCIGVGILLSSTAEFLPRDRITLAGRLRIVDNALFWVFVDLFLLDIVLNVVLSGN